MRIRCPTLSRLGFFSVFAWARAFTVVPNCFAIPDSVSRSRTVYAYQVVRRSGGKAA